MLQLGRRPRLKGLPLPVVAPVGNLSVEDCAPLQQALDKAALGGTDVAVDLSEVESVDSAALAVLLSTHRRLRRRDRSLELRHVGPRVARVLRISGLDQLFAA